MSTPKPVIAPFPVPRGALSVVYYLRRADAAIKIGTSKWLDQRVMQLERLHGTLELLIWEPGDRLLEKQRHHEFQLSIIDGRYEWFRPTRELVRFIADVRAELDECVTENKGSLPDILRPAYDPGIFHFPPTPSPNTEMALIGAH